MACRGLRSDVRTTGFGALHGGLDRCHLFSEEARDLSPFGDRGLDDQPFVRTSLSL